MFFLGLGTEALHVGTFSVLLRPSEATIRLFDALLLSGVDAEAVGHPHLLFGPSNTGHNSSDATELDRRHTSSFNPKPTCDLKELKVLRTNFQRIYT